MCTSLVEACSKYIQKYFVDVARSEEFLSMEQKDIVEILGNDELHVSSEEQVPHGMALWIEWHWREFRLGLITRECTSFNSGVSPMLWFDLMCKRIEKCWRWFTWCCISLYYVEFTVVNFGVNKRSTNVAGYFVINVRLVAAKVF